MFSPSVPSVSCLIVKVAPILLSSPLSFSFNLPIFAFSPRTSQSVLVEPLLKIMIHRKQEVKPAEELVEWAPWLMETRGWGTAL